MSNKRFDTEESAKEYKDKHQLHQYEVVQLTGTGKWAFCFPVEAHITVNDGVSDEFRQKAETELNATVQRFKAPFFVVIDHEQTVSEHPTVEEARSEGQKSCDAEKIPCSFSIQDADGNHVEDIVRSDGRSLKDQVATFNDTFGKR